MELQSGLPLILQQYRALFVKNLIVAWRNKRPTSLQLLSPLFFIFLLFCIQELMQVAKPLTDPVALVSPPIPPCEVKFNIRRPCFDFVWSGNDSRRIGSIVSGMMANNPGRPIPSSKVKSFRTSEEVDEWLFNEPKRCPVAMHFVERNATVISYGIQTNSSKISMHGHPEDLTFKFQIPLQIAAEREIVRSLAKDSDFSWVVGLKEFPHPAIPTSFMDDDSQTSKNSTMSEYGPLFFIAIAMFAFIFQMSSLVTEKELKLRQAMTMMGLYDTAYWLSWFTWEGLLALLSSLLTVIFGMMFRFDFFLRNSFAVVFLSFFLFQFDMIAFAFMLSAFASKSSSSTAVGFFMFIVSVITQEITPLLLTSNMSRKLKNMWLLFPPNLFGQALQPLLYATSTREADGISWRERTKCWGDDMDCFITINVVLIRLASTFFLWVILAIYFDNIIPNSSAVRKPIFYFLRIAYWTNRDENKVEESICSCTSLVPPSEHTRPDDKDVLEEENDVKKQAREGLVDPNVAVQIRGLVKTYRGKRKISRCFCKPNKSSSYHAVKGLWVNFEKDQLFCLLGPNGAGKTTSVSCLTGITPVTSGDALIYGYSIRSANGMSSIRRMIGVCPQFDILWDALSGQEHLHLFARIKGLLPASIKMIAQKSLAQVRLTEAAKMRASSYSGGMKRRLSVAIALIGDPKLVILDEPTTGMDPISRRHVWDIIEDAKKGRAVILTTHSMEEADILSDRIGIMAKGRLRCIGTSIRLKSRFGTGFITNISFSGDINGTSEEASVAARHREGVKQFFKHSLNVVPKEESKFFLTFVISHDKERVLTKFFAELEDRKIEFGIADIQLSLTTLEEVFLNIARQAEFETAEAEGNLATLNLPSGASVEVPLGARFIGIPKTESPENPKGVMVEVYWEQDDSGNLCISGHSDDMPIPPNVQLKASSSTPTASNKNVFGQRGLVYAHVIDPSQIDASNFQ